MKQIKAGDQMVLKGETESARAENQTPWTVVVKYANKKENKIILETQTGANRKIYFTNNRNEHVCYYNSVEENFQKIIENK